MTHGVARKHKMVNKPFSLFSRKNFQGSSVVAPPKFAKKNMTKYMHGFVLRKVYFEIFIQKKNIFFLFFVLIKK